jgi:choline-sulfatase
MPRQPNIVLVMADQLAPQALPIHGHPIVQTPHLARFASQAFVFDRAYCNFPICAPSRASMLSGRLPHSIDAYDNAAEFPASVPTLLHYLVALGYRTSLCGKMHFIGPDQLHGYEERLTTDIYPSDFSWTPDFTKGPKDRPTGVSMRPIIESGHCVRSLQIDYDDEVEFRALQKLHDLARSSDDRPFFLTVSFTHPHPPFVSSREHWDRYRHEDIDMPKVAPIPFDQLDEHSRWLWFAHAQNIYDVTDDHIRSARHAYYAMISYIDDKVGRLMDTVRACGLDDNTVIIFTGDHGEMLGERGMWFKQTFFEWSARVPMMISGPGRLKTGRSSAPVSLVDLLPTVIELAGGRAEDLVVDPIDGRSLLPLIDGIDHGDDRSVISEYSSEGVCAASRMLTDQRYKYIYTRGLPPMLFDLQADPDERINLTGQVGYGAVEQAMSARLLSDWDPEAVHRRILDSQRRRMFLAEVARKSGRFPNWAFQTHVDDTTRFVRGSGSAGPTGVKGKARFPYVPPAKPDRTE